MNAITRSLTSFTRNHIRRQRAKELDALITRKQADQATGKSRSSGQQIIRLLF